MAFTAPFSWTVSCDLDVARFVEPTAMPVSSVKRVPEAALQIDRTPGSPRSR